MNTQSAKIVELVDRLGELLIPFDCAGVRLDYIVSGNGANRRCLILDRFGSGPRPALLSSRENMRQKGLKRLLAEHRIPEATGSLVLDLALELSELNDMGAWTFRADDREPRIATTYGVGGRPRDSLPGYAADMANLRDALSQVSVIEVVTQSVYGFQADKNTKKTNGRKTWAYFYDQAGEQLCAIAVNFLTSVMRDWLSEDEQLRADADRRMGRWANQLNADRDRFVEAARILLHLDVYMGVTKINLVS